MADMDTGVVSSKEKSGKKQSKLLIRINQTLNYEKGKMILQWKRCMKVPFLKVHDRILRLKI